MRAAVLVSALVGAAGTGCADEPRATLVGLRGCGLEGEDLQSLRIVPRGDFPSSAVDAAVVHAGTATLPEIPDDATAITVEGLVGDISIAVGRTPRLDEMAGAMPVYFAARDELCVVRSAVDFRDVGGMAVGPGGDILVVGGRDRDGRLVDDIIHTRDDDELVTPLDRGLAAALTGTTVVPIGPRQFAVFGGARLDGEVLDQWVPIDLTAAQPVARHADRLDAIGVKSIARSYHAAVVLPDGRVLVTGGCAELELDASCRTSIATNVLQNSFYIDPSTEPPTVTNAPPLADPRFEHEMLVARDGAVFVVGGRTYDGGPRLGVERWWPEASGWRSYGKRAGELDLEQNGPITGAALVEGGLLVVAFERGGLGWIDEVAAGSTPAPAILGLDPAQPDACLVPPPGTAYWTAWCDGDPQGDACAFTEGECPSPTARHRVIALPDERVLLDTWLLPFPHLGTQPSDAVDLARMRPGKTSPGRRTEAAMRTLADGTVLLAGGRDPDTLEPKSGFLLRLRPDLGGPDENLPNLALPGGFVLHDPERITATPGGMTLESTQADVEDIPAVWAHLRSFRSASFRFEVSLRRELGAAAYLLLSQGALKRAVIRLQERVVDPGNPDDPGDDRRELAIELLLRDVGGHAEAGITCARLDGANAQLDLRMDVRPDGIVLRNGSAIIAKCPAIGDTPSAIGVGVAGSIVENGERRMGTLAATNLRISRI